MHEIWDCFFWNIGTATLRIVGTDWQRTLAELTLVIVSSTLMRTVETVFCVLCEAVLPLLLKTVWKGFKAAFMRVVGRQLCTLP